MNATTFAANGLLQKLHNASSLSVENSLCCTSSFRGVKPVGCLLSPAPHANTLLLPNGNFSRLSGVFRHGIASNLKRQLMKLGVGRMEAISRPRSSRGVLGDFLVQPAAARNKLARAAGRSSSSGE